MTTALDIFVPKSPLGFIIRLILVALLVALVLSATPTLFESTTTNTVSQTYTVSVLENNYVDMVVSRLGKKIPHFLEQHGIMGAIALKCMNKYGSIDAYNTHMKAEDGTDLNTTTFICFDKKLGQHFVVVLTKAVEEGKWWLITAFKVDRDVFPTLNAFIGYLFEDWDAVKSTLSITAGDFITTFPIP